jgi:hypothetical protein
VSSLTREHLILITDYSAVVKPCKFSLSVITPPADWLLVEYVGTGLTNIRKASAGPSTRTTRGSGKGRRK